MCNFFFNILFSFKILPRLFNKWYYGDKTVTIKPNNNVILN